MRFNYQGLCRLIYWGFDCTGECGMDRYYASFRELESNFRPARVFHSAFAVTSYYAYLKQRTKTLFQILFSLGHCSHSVHTIIYAAIQRQQSGALSLGRHLLTDNRTQAAIDLLSHCRDTVYYNARTKKIK